MLPIGLLVRHATHRAVSYTSIVSFSAAVSSPFVLCNQNLYLDCLVINMIIIQTTLRRCALSFPYPISFSA